MASILHASSICIFSRLESGKQITSGSQVFWSMSCVVGSFVACLFLLELVAFFVLL